MLLQKSFLGAVSHFIVDQVFNVLRLRVYYKLPRLRPSDSLRRRIPGPNPGLLQRLGTSSARCSRQSARFYPLSSARSHPHLGCLIHTQLDLISFLFNIGFGSSNQNEPKPFTPL
jgi:hypothetical protein